MSAGEKKVCFIVGPIGDPDSDSRIHADWILEEIIQPVLSQYPQFSVVRADQIAPPGMIDAQVIQHLLDSDLVIADLSKENPNAFYEIGIRHMAQKPIIHMQLVEEKIPFDVSLYRTLKFSRVRPGDLRKAREELKRAVDAVLSEGYQVDNPITRARGQIRLEERATPEQKVMLDQLRSIQDRLDMVEERSEILYRETRRDDARRSREKPERYTTFYVQLNSKSKDSIPSRDKIRNDLARVRWVRTVGLYDEYIIQFEVPQSELGGEEWKAVESDLRSRRGVISISEIPF